MGLATGHHTGLAVTPQKTVVVLGASRYYTGCLDEARAAGYRVIAVDRNPDAIGFRSADAGVVCDIADASGVLAVAQAYHAAAVIPLNDVGVPTAAYCALHLGRPGLSPDTAHLATDKAAMRARWIATGVPSPQVAIATTRADFDRALERIGFPCILKPAHGIAGGSRGVVVVQCVDELDAAIAFAQRFYDNKETLVETFVDASSEHSVEALVRDGRVHIIAIGDKVKSPLPYRVDTSVLYPTALTGAARAAVEATVTVAVRALGIQHGAAHVELAQTATGPVLFELGARCGGGGTANPIVRESTGISLFTEFVRILAGDPVGSLVATRARGVCYHFLTPAPGGVVAIDGLEAVRAHPGVLDADLFVGVGDTIPRVTVGAERSGFIITTAETAVDAHQLACALEEQIQVTYQ